MLEKRESPLSLYIKKHVDGSPLSDDEIGVICGFKNGNLIRAFAEGEIRPPLDRLSALGEAIRADLSLLFSLAIRELFSPELLEQLQNMNLNHVDHAETTWIRALNEVFDGQIPEINDRLRARLELVVKMP
jgi:hypothetical protein